MTYDEVIKKFGTQERLAAVLGITQPTVACWKRRVPPAYQYELEVRTGGELRVERHLRKAVL